jgi:tRNA(Ile)-lysidine synthase
MQTNLQHFLSQHTKPNQRLLLGLSGGLDSCVLLHLLAKARAAMPFDLQAMHVHHGISPNADNWAAFCQAQCAALNVPLTIVKVQLDEQSKLGLEGHARQLRYDALFNNALQADYVLSAHHQDDQAETLLLQLFRGAGLKGLASMAAADERRGLLRPLLNVPRSSLEDYAKQRGLSWCEDESNSNTQYERNFIRHDVLPLLSARNPAIKQALARTAAHAAEASDLLNDLAALDASHLLANNSLCTQGLAALDAARARNALRWWMAMHEVNMPSADALSEMHQQLMTAKADANIDITLQLKNQQAIKLKRYKQRAYLVKPAVTASFDLVWNGEPALDLPNGGTLLFSQVQGSGLALKLGMSKLRISQRNGGESFKPNVLRPTRTLKHLLQEANMPPWQRENLPLVYWQDTLAYVPGIGISHELQAAPHEDGLHIDWQP